MVHSGKVYVKFSAITIKGNHGSGKFRKSKLDMGLILDIRSCWCSIVVLKLLWLN